MQGRRSGRCPRSEMITAIILAAGESRRMGTLKQVLPWGDATVVEAAVDAAQRATEVDEVVVVIGHEAQAVRAALETRTRPKMRIVVNPHYHLGMVSSVKAGVRALEPCVEAFLVAPADQPGIRPEVYDRVVRAYRKLGPQAQIVVPVCGRKGGHPTLFAAGLCQEILDLPHCGEGLRDILRKHEGKVARVEVEDLAVAEDLDTMEEYERALRRTSCH